MGKFKTEHSGAKNGSGHWGNRDEAKTLSKKNRRANQKAEIRAELQAINAPLKLGTKEKLKFKKSIRSKEV